MQKISQSILFQPLKRSETIFDSIYARFVSQVIRTEMGGWNGLIKLLVTYKKNWILFSNSMENSKLTKWNFEE